MAYPTDLDNWYGPSVTVSRGKVTTKELTRAEKEAKYDDSLKAIKEDWKQDVKSQTLALGELKARVSDYKDWEKDGLVTPEELSELEAQYEAAKIELKAFKDKGEPTEVPPPIPYEPPSTELPL